MKAGWMSAGILINEIVVVAGVPIALVYLLGFDRRRIVGPGKIDAVMLGLLVVFILGADVLIDYATLLSERVLPLSEEMRDALDRMMEAEGSGAIVWKIFVLCIVPGFCEEIFFRGFCQTSLAAKWGRGWAIVVASIIFALMHGNPYYVHLYFLLGIVFGWIYFATGTLWAAIFCHVLNNAWTFINHVRGFEFPIDASAPIVDVVVASLAVLFVFLSAKVIRARS